MNSIDGTNFRSFGMAYPDTTTGVRRLRVYADRASARSDACHWVWRLIHAPRVSPLAVMESLWSSISTLR